MEAGSVREALKTWQDNYIHVQGVMDEFVTLKERTKYLRDEVKKSSQLSCSCELVLLFVYLHVQSWVIPAV